MPKYKLGEMVIFVNSSSPSSYLKGVIKNVIQSGSEGDNHYSIICEILQCEILVQEKDIIDLAY